MVLEQSGQIANCIIVIDINKTFSPSWLKTFQMSIDSLQTIKLEYVTFGRVENNRNQGKIHLQRRRDLTLHLVAFLFCCSFHHWLLFARLFAVVTNNNKRPTCLPLLLLPFLNVVNVFDPILPIYHLLPLLNFLSWNVKPGMTFNCVWNGQFLDWASVDVLWSLLSSFIINEM